VLPETNVSRCKPAERRYEYLTLTGHGLFLQLMVCSISYRRLDIVISGAISPHFKAQAQNHVP
jgi:hypothetical protein